jgi:predicted nucleic acid-binding protein
MDALVVTRRNIHQIPWKWLGRAKGVSLTTIDALIAAIALEHRASVFTLDKDFSRIARLTGLPLHPLPGP